LVLVDVVKVGGIACFAQARCVPCLGDDMASHCVGKVVTKVMASTQAAGYTADVELVGQHALLHAHHDNLLLGGLDLGMQSHDLDTLPLQIEGSHDVQHGGSCGRYVL